MRYMNRYPRTLLGCRWLKSEKTEQTAFEQVRRRDIGQRAQDRFDAARLLAPLLQHPADLLALQIFLRAAKRAGDDGKGHRLCIFDQIFFSNISQGADDHMP